MRRISVVDDLLVPTIAVSLALTVAGVLILAMGINPLSAYVAMFLGAFGSANSISETLLKATPLMLAGLGLAIAYNCKVWNIGAEGQLYIGAWLATWAGIVVSGIPQPIHILLLTLVGFMGGALWALIPALLKTRFQLNEIITTIMMNYIATIWISYLVRIPMIDPESYGYPQSQVLSISAWLPRILPETRLNIGFLMALVFAVILQILLFKTTLGFKITAVGANQEAARYGGMKIATTILMTMAISGGLAGIAGMVEIAGVHHRLRAGFSPGYGFTAIVVSLLGRNRPLGVVLSAILFGALIVGADSMQQSVGVPFFLSYIIQGLVVLFMVSREIYIRKWR